MNESRRLVARAGMVPPAPVVALVALVAIQALLLAPLFGAGHPMGEDLSIHLAEISHLARAIAAGDAGLWNPSANLGFASGYYYQILPQLLPALASVCLGDLVALLLLFKLAIALPLALLPVTTYRALRVVEVAPGPALGGAAAGSFVFSTVKWGLGPDAVFIEGLYTQAWALLFFPLALAHAYRFVASGRGVGRAVGYCLLTGLCHPFFGVSLAPALLATRFWRVGWRACARRLATLGGLSLVASAFFWLPILVHYDSFGAFPAREQTEEGLPLLELLGLVLRGDLLDAQRLPVLTVLAGAALALAARGNWLVRALLAQAAAFAALMIVGRALGKTPGDLLPPVRFLAPLQLALAAAAGVAGAELATRAWQRPQAFAVRGLVALVGAALATALLAGSAKVMKQRLRTAADFPFVAFDELEEITTALKGHLPGRWLADQMFGTGYHYWMYLPFVEAGTPALRAHGGAALQSSPNYQFLLRFDPAAHSFLYGLRYVLVSREMGIEWRGAQLLARTKHHELFELPTGSSFAPVQVVGALPDEKAARLARVSAWLASAGPERAQVLAVGAAQQPGPSPRGRVLGESEAPSEYRADVEAAGPDPTTFLLRVTYHPGWRAALDGQAVPIRRVSPDLMAVDVPHGRHRIAFRFRRPWWTWLLMSAPVLLLVAHLRMHARRQRAAAGPLAEADVAIASGQAQKESRGSVCPAFSGSK